MYEPLPLPRRSPWMCQFLVIKALLQREVATRFGEYKLGFFWMLLEPLLGVIVIGLIIGTLAGRTVPEIPYSFFLLNGMLLLKLFTGTMNSGINAIGANQGLLVYPTVRPLDPFLARFVFELMTTAFSFSLFCVAGLWLGVRMSLGALEILAAAMLITWMLGCGLGLLLGVSTAYFQETDKVATVLQRPLLFVSAVLVPAASIPSPARDYLLKNPLVHTIEMSRHALFPHYHYAEVNLVYPFCCAVVVLSLGLTLFHNSRDYLSQR